jgi:hypothetical protein
MAASTKPQIVGMKTARIGESGVSRIYRRRERPASKKLGPYMAWIDKVLEGDRAVHKKQRHTTHRIFERLRAEEGFPDGYTIVRQYVAQATLRAREMFVPLSHRPGHALPSIVGLPGGLPRVPPVP